MNEEFICDCGDHTKNKPICDVCGLLKREKCEKEKMDISKYVQDMEKKASEIKRLRLIIEIDRNRIREDIEKLQECYHIEVQVGMVSKRDVLKILDKEKI